MAGNDAECFENQLGGATAGKCRCQGMFGSDFKTVGQLQRVHLVAGCECMHRMQCRFAGRQGAGLVKDDMVDRAEFRKRIR